MQLGSEDIITKDAKLALSLASSHVVRTGEKRWGDKGHDTKNTRGKFIFYIYTLSLWDAGTTALPLGYPGGGTPQSPVRGPSLWRPGSDNGNAK
jgi:hypothetical protein